jgi:molybdopterin converting factor small subunit
VSVKVKIPSLLNKYANGQELLEVEGSSVMECAHNLIIQLPELKRWLYDKQGELRPQLWFFINGERIYADEFTKSLKEGDELFFLLASGGG